LALDHHEVMGGSTSIRSLSLSLTSTSRCLLYLSIFSVRISSSVSAKKQRPVQS
jgi:hypothetical protein